MSRQTPAGGYTGAALRGLAASFIATAVGVIAFLTVTMIGYLFLDASGASGVTLESDGPVSRALGYLFLTAIRGAYLLAFTLIPGLLVACILGLPLGLLMGIAETLGPRGSAAIVGALIPLALGVATITALRQWDISSLYVPLLAAPATIAVLARWVVWGKRQRAGVTRIRQSFR